MTGFMPGHDSKPCQPKPIPHEVICSPAQRDFWLARSLFCGLFCNLFYLGLCLAGQARHRAPLTPYPSTHARPGTFSETPLYPPERETGFGRVRYQHVDATGTPIDDG